MKKIISGSLFLFTLVYGPANAQQIATTTSAQAGVTAGTAASIGFKETANTYEFGTIPQGTPVTHNFIFTNTGKSPLVLSSVTPSCGCTSPEWPKEAIAAGKSGVIKVTYNAQAPGPFTKSITVVSNAANPQTVLFIKGEVKVTQQETNTQPASTPKTSLAPKKN